MGAGGISGCGISGYDLHRRAGKGEVDGAGISCGTADKAMGKGKEHLQGSIGRSVARTVIASPTHALGQAHHL